MPWSSAVGSLWARLGRRLMRSGRLAGTESHTHTNSITHTHTHAHTRTHARTHSHTHSHNHHPSRPGASLRKRGRSLSSSTHWHSHAFAQKTEECERIRILLSSAPTGACGCERTTAAQSHTHTAHPALLCGCERTTWRIPKPLTRKVWEPRGAHGYVGRGAAHMRLGATRATRLRQHARVACGIGSG